MIFDRIITAQSIEEMGRKLRQPVLAFAHAERADDGSSIVDSTAMEAEDERAVVATTLDSLRHSVLLPPFLSDADCRTALRDSAEELPRALKQLQETAAALPEKPTAEDIARVRVEADNLHLLAEEIAMVLTSWELSTEEWERDERGRSERRKRDKDSR